MILRRVEWRVRFTSHCSDKFDYVVPMWLILFRYGGIL